MHIWNMPGEFFDHLERQLFEAGVTTVDHLAYLHQLPQESRTDEQDAVKRAGSALWQWILLFPAFQLATRAI